jgi:hypothetical protein
LHPFASSVVGIPTGGTFIPRDISVGIHKTRGYSYHCDTGIINFPTKVLHLKHNEVNLLDIFQIVELLSIHYGMEMEKTLFRATSIFMLPCKMSK